jgi:hypothetical protein
MLVTLVKSFPSIPTLPVLIPADFKDTRGGILRGFFQKKLLLFFMCPVTKKLAKSGPNGSGYSIVQSREWLVKAAPVIRLGLMVAKIAAAAYGIPLPIPMPSLGDTSSDLFMSSLIDNAVSSIDDEVSRLPDSLPTETYSVKELNEAVKSGDDVSQPSFAEATGTAYEALYRLVKQLENGDSEAWSPRHSGLIKVVSQKDGTTAWVSVGKGEELFHANGIEALR